MMVSVRLFARAKELAGTDRLLLAIEVNGGQAVVADIRRELERVFPSLVGLAARSVFALNDDIVDDSCPVPAWAELALLPPVSGG